MNKKKLGFILITCMISLLFLTSCKSKEKVLFMSYSDANDISRILSVQNSETSTQNLFANDLCVIPLNSDIGGDKALTSESTLMVNITDKKTVYADAVFTKIYPASLTKLATAFVAYKHSKMTDIVSVKTNNGGITDPSAKLIGLKKGDKVVMRDLISAMLVYSGNDASVAIAEHIGGSVQGFSKIMNEELKRIGAVKTNFVNPHGLHDDAHYTTTYDLYLIFNEVLKNPELKKMCGYDTYLLKYTNSLGSAVSKELAPTNKFILGTALEPKGINVLGGKTGTTDLAGNCLIVYSMDTSKKEYISVILKNTSQEGLYDQMTYLLGLYN